MAVKIQNWKKYILKIISIHDISYFWLFVSGFECCSLQTFWSIIFTVIWFIWGLVVACYCTTNETSITRTNNTGIGSIFEVKTLNKNHVITSTDQFVVVATPFILVLAWIVALALGWSRIEQLSELCYSFCKRGFRIDSSPEVAVILQFLVNYFIFLIGQTIVNVQIALIYCPDSSKQILFSSEFKTYTCLAILIFLCGPSFDALFCVFNNNQLQLLNIELDNPFRIIPLAESMTSSSLYDLHWPQVSD